MSADLPPAVASAEELSSEELFPRTSRRCRGLRWAGWGVWTLLAVPLFFHGVKRAADDHDRRVVAFERVARGGRPADTQSPTAMSVLCERATALGFDLRPPGSPSATGRVDHAVALWNDETAGPDNALAQLAAVPDRSAVTSLRVSRNRMSPACLAKIAALPNLREWTIEMWSGHRREPYGIEILPFLRTAAKIPSLRVLRLSEMTLTAEERDALADLTQVTTLIVRDVEGASHDELRALLPGAVIVEAGDLGGEGPRYPFDRPWPYGDGA